MASLASKFALDALTLSARFGASTVNTWSGRMKHKSQLKRKNQDREAAGDATACRHVPFISFPSLPFAIFSCVFFLAFEDRRKLSPQRLGSGISAPEGTNILVTLSRSEPVIRGQEVEHFANRMSAWAKD